MSSSNTVTMSTYPHVQPQMKNISLSKRRLSSGSEAPQVKRLQLPSSRESSDVQCEAFSALKHQEQPSNAPVPKAPASSNGYKFSSEGKDSLYQAVKKAFEDDPPAPIPPYVRKKRTKEERREYNMTLYGTPHRPRPDDEFWKWQPNEDNDEWDYEPDLDGYFYHSPRWFEESDGED